MNKIIVTILILVAALGGGYYFYSNSKSTDIVSNSNLVSPTRPAEITGYVVSILGNEVTVAKEIGKVTLSEAEQAKKKADMQKMSPEQRSAIKAEESAKLTTENVKLIIPVGTSISKGTGDATGEQIEADIAELLKGTYVSIWMDQNQNIEYVKIKQI